MSRKRCRNEDIVFPNNKKIKNELTLASMCSAVISGVLFPFLDLPDHIQFAQTCTQLLRTSGLLPPKLPSLSSSHTLSHVLVLQSWTKSVTLPETVNDWQLKKFCHYARSVFQLNLSCCSLLTNISPLLDCTNLQVIDLYGCRQLTQVSGLVNCSVLYSLNLGGCVKLTDISALTDINSLKTLHLSHCMLLTDVSALTNMPRLHTLYLDNCGRLEDITPLSNIPTLHTLDLTNCFQITDVSALHNNPKLDTLILSGCNRLTDINALGNGKHLQTLDLSGCNNLEDVSGLGTSRSLRDVSLYRCCNLTGVHKFCNICTLQYLRIEWYYHPKPNKLTQSRFLRLLKVLARNSI
jgi:Leucine-rich repeat (LRR) protein